LSLMMVIGSPGRDQQKRTSGLTASSPGERSHATRPARILLVEDDFLVALELEHRLLEAGFLVVGTASTAEEALELAASEKPELAIMDIRLAGLRDGIDAAKDLNAKLGVPSIFATAHANEAIRKRGEDAKPLGWLQKPYSTDALITLVNKAVSRPK